MDGVPIVYVVYESGSQLPFYQVCLVPAPPRLGACSFCPHIPPVCLTDDVDGGMPWPVALHSTQTFLTTTQTTLTHKATTGGQRATQNSGAVHTAAALVLSAAEGPVILRCKRHCLDCNASVWCTLVV